MIDSLTALQPVIEGVDADVANYVETHIIPLYDRFDKAHRRDHARMVITQSLRLAAHMPQLNRDMVYVTAAFHDLGLANGRERHHIDSGIILGRDEFVRHHFTADQIKVMIEAVEDHRASGKSAPRSDYGLVVADADRFIDAETIIRRTIQYGMANYPHLDRDGHFQRTSDHLINKYGPDGYMKVRLPWSDNATRLKQLHAIIADGQRLREIFDRIYSAESRIKGS
ncbi:MAG: HD domain-containing protein [Bacteroidales bacterium]|nr:HD domain-containing protein [Bacteroidales bacterium]